MADKKSIDIRKLRKKLRQIEHLEQVDRDLTEEEYSKVLTKVKVRKEIQKLTAEREKEQKNLHKMTKKDENQVSIELNNENREVREEVAQNGAKNVVESDETQTQSCELHSEPEVTSSSSNDATLTTPRLELQENKSSPSTSVTNTSSAVSMASSSSSSTVSMAPPPSSTSSSAVSMAPSSSSTVSRTSPSSSIVKSTKVTNQHQSSPQKHKEWLDAMFSVQCLEGHNDLVLDVDCNDTLLISGSRDTTLRLWDADTGRELRSMGGHTGSVTSVKLIPYIDITFNDEEVSLTKAFNHMAITGSKDCSIRLWSLGDGQMRRSIYTYSSVECLDYSKKNIASGSDGGKVELWDINTGENIRSIKGHDDMVTCIKFQDDGRVVSGSTTGVVKVWDIRDSSLRPVFDSEQSEVIYKKRQIRSLATKGDHIYWGDDGANIKVLELASGRLRKIRNHENDFGSTNAMTTTGSCLISAGYDIDKGNGYMNVRSLPDEGYLATINDNNTGCITCLSCSQVKREGQTFNRICTGGSDLKLWNQLSSKPKKRTRSEGDDGFVTTKHIRRYSEANLSDTDSSDDDDDEDDFNNYDDGDDDEDAADNATRSWCTIS